MGQFRSLLALLIGLWLGASIVTDVAVTQNFQSVDRFLSAAPNSIDRAQQRVILRLNAADENNWIFTNWERAEFVLGAGLILLIVKSGSPRFLLTAGIALVAMIAVERFYLTPRIVDMGRFVDGLPKADERYKTFWMLHGFYSGIDILKMLMLFGMSLWVAVPGRLRPERTAEAIHTDPAAAFARGRH